jgi:hypothetical protein
MVACCSLAEPVELAAAHTPAAGSGCELAVAGRLAAAHAPAVVARRQEQGMRFCYPYLKTTNLKLEEISLIKRSSEIEITGKRG